MNKEILKAMTKKNESSFKKWWQKNSYKVFRIILFPIWFFLIIKNKINTWWNSKETWNKERAIEILTYYIPRRSEWNEHDNTLYFFDNGMGWHFALAKHYLKRKDRRFWRVNGAFFGGKIRQFLINEFELEGFTKQVIDNSDTTEIIFRLN